MEGESLVMREFALASSLSSREASQGERRKERTRKEEEEKSYAVCSAVGKTIKKDEEETERKSCVEKSRLESGELY